MSDPGSGLTVERGREVSGDDGLVTKGSQRLGTTSAANALPSNIRSRVLASIFLAGESELATYRAARVRVREPGRQDVEWGGAGQGSYPILVLTRLRLLLFFEFAKPEDTGGGGVVLGYINLYRGFDSYPFQLGVAVSPCQGGRFTVSWTSGLELDVFAKSQGSLFSRRRPVKEFHQALLGVVSTVS